jgi:hypothetical protein
MAEFFDHRLPSIHEKEKISLLKQERRWGQVAPDSANLAPEEYTMKFVV